MLLHCGGNVNIIFVSYIVNGLYDLQLFLYIYTYIQSLCEVQSDWLEKAHPLPRIEENMKVLSHFGQLTDKSPGQKCHLIGPELLMTPQC